MRVTVPKYRFLSIGLALLQPHFLPSSWSVPFFDSLNNFFNLWCSRLSGGHIIFNSLKRTKNHHYPSNPSNPSKPSSPSNPKNHAFLQDSNLQQQLCRYLLLLFRSFRSMLGQVSHAPWRSKGLENHVKTECFCKVTPIYHNNVDQFRHVDSCGPPLPKTDHAFPSGIWYF